MKKVRIRIRLKVYTAIWSIIIVLAAYILIRFAVISFSEDMGQASFWEAMITKLCSDMIESDALVSYTSNKEKGEYSFPLTMLNDELVLAEFVEEDEILTSNYHQDYSSLFGQSNKVTAKAVEHTSAAMKKSSGMLGIYVLDSNKLDIEYILTNGAVLQSDAAGVLVGEGNATAGQLQIGYLEGDIGQNKPVNEETDHDSAVQTVTADNAVKYTMEQLKDTNFLVRNFYVVDGSTTVTDSLFDAEKLLNKDMTIKQTNDAPQILIYHTHSREAFANSRPNKEADTVVGVGTYLTKILEEDYGYNVIHDKTSYDIVNGVEDRNVAYNQAEDGIAKILEENPSIEVIIDLHRNSGKAKTVMLNGKETAQIMLFNGLSRDQNGPITYLDNPNQQSNLAFSLQMQLKGREIYPGLFNKNYLKCYRYNMHFRPKSMLIELGTVNNTLESAKNAMIPFAEVLNEILQGE